VAGGAGRGQLRVIGAHLQLAPAAHPVSIGKSQSSDSLVPKHRAYRGAPTQNGSAARRVALRRPAQRVAPRYFGGDFGDDSATLARAAAWRRENPELAEKQAEFFHRLWDNPGGAVTKETLLALELSTRRGLQARVRHLRPRLHVAPRVPML